MENQKKKKISITLTSEAKAEFLQAVQDSGMTQGEFISAVVSVWRNSRVNKSGKTFEVTQIRDQFEKILGLMESTFVKFPDKERQAKEDVKKFDHLQAEDKALYQNEIKDLKEKYISIERENLKLKSLLKTAQKNILTLKELQKKSIQLENDAKEVKLLKDKLTVKEKELSEKEKKMSEIKEEFVSMRQKLEI